MLFCLVEEADFQTKVISPANETYIQGTVDDVYLLAHSLFLKWFFDSISLLNQQHRLH